MSTIVTRAGKGSPLTNNEVDANFTNLNTDKLEGPASSVDSEIALFNSTTGKLLKSATMTGTPYITSGVLGTNKVTFTQPATGATLTLADGSTLTTSGAYSWQFTVPGAYTYTLPSATCSLVPAGSATTSGLTMNTARLLGRTTASSGAIEEITVGTGLSLSGGSLTATATSSGALTYLSTVTASNSATVDVETTFDSTYDVYMLVASGVTVQTSAQELYIRMKIGGSYLTTNTYYSHCSIANAGSTNYVGSNNNGATVITIAPTMNNSSDASSDFVIYIYNPSSTTFHKTITWEGSYKSSTPNYCKSHGSGWNSGTSALTGIQFLTSSGNIVSGSFRLYGLKTS